MAAWLAEPAPIGALDYVSPEATIVTAFAAKDAIAVFDEMLPRLPDLKQHMDEAGARLGFNLRDDLAQAFGHEFVFAMDGPILADTIVEAHSRSPRRRETRPGAAEDGGSRQRGNWQRTAGRSSPWPEEEDGGRRYLHGTAPDAKTAGEWHIVFTDGYMIAAPSRALLDKAMGYQSAGNNLLTSDEFTAMLPTDGYNNFLGDGVPRPQVSH